MSRKEEIEKALQKVFKRQSAFGDEDKDAAKITEDKELAEELKGNVGRSKIKMQQGIDEDEKWGGKVVNSNKAFNRLSEDSSNEEEEQKQYINILVLNENEHFGIVSLYLNKSYFAQMTDVPLRKNFYLPNLYPKSKISVKKFPHFLLSTFSFVTKFISPINSSFK